MILPGVETDDSQDSAIRSCGNRLNEKDICCDEMNTTSIPNEEDDRKYKMNRRESMRQKTKETKTNIKASNFNITHKDVIQGSISDEEYINNHLGYLLRRSENTKFKDVTVRRMKYKEQLNVANKEMRKEESSDVTETKEEEEEDSLDDIDDYIERFVESDNSENSVCCGNIFCDCSSCNLFRKNLLTTKPTKNHKYVCNLCQKTFRRKDYLKNHQKRDCNTLKLYACDICVKSFTEKSTLTYHLRMCHTTNPNEKNLKFSCNICEKQFTYKNGLYRHKRDIHFLPKLNVTYNCDLCQKRYKSKQGLHRHTWDTHSDDSFECGHCSKVFRSKNKLRIHIEIAHFLKTPLKCDWPSCDKIYQSAIALRKHREVVHSKSFTPFTCEHCGKCFHAKCRLERHLLTHTDEKPCMCQVCGKCFRTDTNLEQHSRTHSTKRPYSCGLCPKAFRIKHHLRQHMAVHGMIHTSVNRRQKDN